MVLRLDVALIRAGVYRMYVPRKRPTATVLCLLFPTYRVCME